MPTGKAQTSRLSFLLPAIALWSASPAFSAPPAGSFTSPPPQGSYTLTCKDIAYDEGLNKLRAVCKAKSGNYLFLSASGQVWDKENTNVLYTKFCVAGSIANIDAHLRCTEDVAKKTAYDAEMKALGEKYKAEQTYKIAESQAIPAWNSASAVVFGRLPTVEERKAWSHFAYDRADSRAQMQAGFKFSQGVAVLKSLMTLPAWGSWRSAMIDNAFREVWGRDSTPAEQALYDADIRAGKIWYAPLVLKEAGRLGSTAGALDGVVQQMSMDCLGRPATPAEVANWKAKAGHYRPMLAHCRVWLYSSGGATELAETVKRALAARQKTAPTDAQIKAAMTKYAEKKAVFAEMYEQMAYFLLKTS